MGDSAKSKREAVRWLFVFLERRFYDLSIFWRKKLPKSTFSSNFVIDSTL